MGNVIKNKNDNNNEKAHKYKIIDKYEIKINKDKNNIDIVNNIIYIKIIKSLFCLCKGKLICISYENFKRNIKYENFLKNNIDFLYYQENTQKMFISNKNESFIYLFQNDSFILKSKLSISILNIFEISKNKYLILKTNFFCLLLIEDKDGIYRQIKTYVKKINTIQVCPLKDKFLGYIKGSLILIDINTFQLISLYKTGNSYVDNPKIYFFNKTDFIIASLNSINIFNIKYMKIIYEYKIQLTKCYYNFLKIGNQGDFIICFMCNYFKPIIFEYKNKIIKKKGEVPIESGIDSIFCKDDYIFIGDCNRILIYKFKIK